ncbi:MAG: hypothetical protein A3F04_00665 [Candidatus Chisholmbacteria bacterium RIFCSPHIGHO2_12_FULL_49_9]|uniref:VIT family protein n=1 Tax=Candidatus Chisholmbacteria bacterium RIFCSPHIGHO2_01_FULL_52_32 TaxID=1797591 RepID=A0A1G1VTG2_9BACT|nr:MAG: hypothetical protein A2786_04365 [Candidatus Chisholmbacteria bacterium RIFCSPHIGHO2_01_FULL_52_32]OGY19929.1 MAG: hypothetical protein A2900_02380 [Candidatus Chisholmbacteria bacterium RIFCSPLOWO2_01_FULL_50_28]OGY20834.1 MAG: hypothetical protein A3F04_00665 [Candidatus Chisholmbacteria bacterium RIFCSPHIGHO2_12_FULL_49_9]
MSSLTSLVLSSIRVIIFSLEDSLVSTLGVVTGIAAGTKDRFVILLSGLIVILVESLSMAAGTYLSDKSEKEAHFAKRTKLSLHRRRRIDEIDRTNPAREAWLMGAFYVLGGSVPILPYLFLPVSWAIAVSVLATLVTLFLVGVEKGRLTQTSPLRSGFEMVTVSFAAAAIGFLVGRASSIVFPGLRAR